MAVQRIVDVQKIVRAALQQLVVDIVQCRVLLRHLLDHYRA